MDVSGQLRVVAALPTAKGSSVLMEYGVVWAADWVGLGALDKRKVCCCGR
jgi:hypothetical protein